MELKKIEQEVNKLTRQHKQSRWIALIIYFSGLIFCFYLVNLKYGGIVEGKLYELAASDLQVFLASYFGVMIGVTLGRWSGSDELKLLRKIASEGEKHNKPV